MSIVHAPIGRTSRTIIYSKIAIGRWKSLPVALKTFTFKLITEIAVLLISARKGFIVNKFSMK
jgi:hypothetical protein